MNPTREIVWNAPRLAKSAPLLYKCNWTLPPLVCLSGLSPAAVGMDESASCKHLGNCTLIMTVSSFVGAPSLSNYNEEMLNN